MDAKPFSTASHWLTTNRLLDPKVIELKAEDDLVKIEALKGG